MDQSEAGRSPNPTTQDRKHIRSLRCILSVGNSRARELESSRTSETDLSGWLFRWSPVPGPAANTLSGISNYISRLPFRAFFLCSPKNLLSFQTFLRYLFTISWRNYRNCQHLGRIAKITELRRDVFRYFGGQLGPCTKSLTMALLTRGPVGLFSGPHSPQGLHSWQAECMEARLPRPGSALGRGPQKVHHSFSLATVGRTYENIYENPFCLPGPTVRTEKTALARSVFRVEQMMAPSRSSTVTRRHRLCTLRRASKFLRILFGSSFD